MSNSSTRRVDGTLGGVHHAPTSNRRLTNEELNKKNSTGKPRLWKIIISHRIYGYEAPSLYVETTEPNRSKAQFAAERLARQLSGLGRFSSWKFEAVKLEYKLIKGRWVYNHNFEENSGEEKIPE